MEVAERNRYQQKCELNSDFLPIWVGVVWEGNKVGDSFEVIWVGIIVAENSNWLMMRCMLCDHLICLTLNGAIFKVINLLSLYLLKMENINLLI